MLTCVHTACCLLLTSCDLRVSSKSWLRSCNLASSAFVVRDRALSSLVRNSLMSRRFIFCTSKSSPRRILSSCSLSPFAWYLQDQEEDLVAKACVLAACRALPYMEGQPSVLLAPDLPSLFFIYAITNSFSMSALSCASSCGA